MKKESFSVNDIRSLYPAEKRESERQRKVWLYYMGRRPSFYLTQVFLKWGISANQVTYISYLIAVLSCLFLAIGNFSIKILGVILLNSYLILDCTDGNIARYSNTTSKYGEFLDALGSYFIATFLLISIGIGAFLNPELAKFSINKIFFLFLSLWSAFSYISARLVSQRYRMIVFRDTDINGLSEIGHPNKFHFIISGISYNLFGVSGFLIPLLLFALIFKCLDLLISLYSAVNTCALILILFQSLIKIRRA